MSKPRAERSWRVVIPGQPAAQARPRFANGRAYRAGRSVQWETAAGLLMIERWNQELPQSSKPSGPLFVSAEFVFSRPSRLKWKRRPTPRLLHEKKPDLDNCLKSLCDALQGCGIVADDSSICSLTATKWYAAGNEQPHVSIVLSWQAPEAKDDEERRVVEGEG